MFENLVSVFWLKILKFFHAVLDPGSEILSTLDPGSCQPWIRDGKKRFIIPVIKSKYSDSERLNISGSDQIRIHNTVLLCDTETCKSPCWPRVVFYRYLFLRSFSDPGPIINNLFTIWIVGQKLIICTVNRKYPDPI